MKTHLKIFILFLSLIGLISCEDVLDKFTKFDLNYSSEISVPATTIINTPIELDTPQIQSNSNSTFSNNDTAKDLIESVKLTEMKLEIKSPDSGNFNFLKEIKLFIRAEGLEKTEIASKSNIENNGASTILLDVTNTDLKEYIKKDNFELSISTVTDETIEEKHDIEILTTFFVDAKVLGI